MRSRKVILSRVTLRDHLPSGYYSILYRTHSTLPDYRIPSDHLPPHIGKKEKVEVKAVRRRKLSLSWHVKLDESEWVYSLFLVPFLRGTDDLEGELLPTPSISSARCKSLASSPVVASTEEGRRMEEGKGGQDGRKGKEWKGQRPTAELLGRSMRWKRSIYRLEDEVGRREGSGATVCLLKREREGREKGR